MPADKLYTLADVAAKLEVSDRTIRRYIKSGKFPDIQQLTGGTYIFKESDLQQFKQQFGDPRKRERRVYLKSTAQPKEKRAYNKRKGKGKKS